MIRGMAKRNSFAAIKGVAPYLAMKSAILRRVSEPTKIAVKAATPNRNGPKNSFNIYLSNIRIRRFPPFFSLQTEIFAQIIFLRDGVMGDLIRRAGK